MCSSLECLDDTGQILSREGTNSDSISSLKIQRKCSSQEENLVFCVRDNQDPQGEREKKPTACAWPLLDLR